MRAEFKWDKDIVKEKSGGKDGMLFLAATAARLMDPYVPADKLVLAQNISITADEECGHVTYNSPYAHYQYVGEIYGPNRPIKDGEEIMGYWSPPHKKPTGRFMKHNTYRHPLATSKWDEAMMTARKGDLARAYEDYLKQRGK